MREHLVIVGAGQSGRELARRMARNWSVAVVDRDPEKLARLEEEDIPPEVVRVDGDATERETLERAGAGRALGLAALTGRDDTNLEVCRVAREHFRVERLMAMVNLRRRLKDFKEKSIHAISRSNAVAAYLQARMEQGKRTTSEVGLGQGEILEVTVLPGSPAVGKTLAELHPQSWVVGMIYRAGTLEVPHGRTVIREKDRVLLLGDPHILPAIADYFRSGASEFPLQIGTRVVVANPYDAPEGRSVDESFYLARSSRAFGLNLMVTPQQDPETLKELCLLAEIDYELEVPPDFWLENVQFELESRDCGCLVVPAPLLGIVSRLGVGPWQLRKVLEQADRPVLVSRGSYPYRKILLASAPVVGAGREAELALDLARLLEAELHEVCTLPAVFPRQEAPLRGALEQIAALGDKSPLEVRYTVLEGNPVKRILEEAVDHDLLVIGHRPRRARSSLRRDVSWHLMLQAPCSVLVVPHGDPRASVAGRGRGVEEPSTPSGG